MDFIQVLIKSLVQDYRNIERIQELRKNAIDFKDYEVTKDEICKE